jgi:tRNA(adenine34) deaminase
MAEQTNLLKIDDNQDRHWMGVALAGARRAAQQGEVPVGAVLVIEGRVIAKAFNKKEQWHTPLGHAELICLQRASKKLARWRLSDATLYVTLEPCAMCAGALVQARLGRLVYGATDPKAGAVASLFQIASDARLNHRCDITAGVLGQECGHVLTEFFRARRQVGSLK